MVNNFQRIGAVSNAHVGDDFEDTAQLYFLSQGKRLQKRFKVSLGLSSKKVHDFDLGAAQPPVLVECKSHKWTSGGKVPSGKIHIWNEAMYYFHLAPRGYRKILFVLRDYDDKKRETLAQYYIRTQRHLIPDDVEILEFDATKSTAVSLPVR